MSGAGPLTVLVVDDSLTTRALISAALRRDPRVRVVGTAGTPFEARDKIVQMNPDVLTLDFEMPSMNGLQFLEKISRLRPMPVVMVSGHATTSSDLVDQALAMGASEWYAKVSPGTDPYPFSGLADAIIRAVTSFRNRSRFSTQLPEPCLKSGTRAPKIVGIGASTGGVEALAEVLAHFPESCPPTAIVQHMPRQFSASFARRLNALVRAEVKLAEDGEPLRPGVVHIAPGGDQHLRIVKTGRDAPFSCQLVAGPSVNGHRPSVDELFHSLARAAGADAVGVILTGMESDGARGLLAMRKAGARTIGQDEASSVIYGMPRAAFELGAVQAQLSLADIGPAILTYCERRSLETHP